MIATVRLQSTENTIYKERCDSPEVKTGENIALVAVDDSDPAKNNFVQPGSSPFLEMSLHISEPSQFAFFEPGKRYRCTIEPI